MLMLQAPLTVTATTRRFTVDEYYRMGEVGIIHPEERVELLDGEIVAMSPIGPLHNAVVLRLNAILNQTLAGRYLVSIQSPIRLSQRSEPQPDVAVVQARADYYATAHPSSADVLLLIEVADTTLAFDRGAKLALYAAAGIAEFWIVDLAGQQIEQHYDPSGNQYRSKQTYGRGQAISAQAVPALALAVDALLG
jgi:Uma2 family endonuclease